MLETEAVVGLKERYQVNRTYAFAHLKHCLPRWLLIGLPTAKQFLMTISELVKDTYPFLG